MPFVARFLQLAEKESRQQPSDTTPKIMPAVPEIASGAHLEHAEENQRFADEAVEPRQSDARQGDEDHAQAIAFNFEPMPP